MVMILGCQQGHFGHFAQGVSLYLLAKLGLLAFSILYYPPGKTGAVTRKAAAMLILSNAFF